MVPYFALWQTSLFIVTNYHSYIFTITFKHDNTKYLGLSHKRGRLKTPVNVQAGLITNEQDIFAIGWELNDLSTKTIEGPSLTFQGIDNVHGGDSLSASMLSVCDTVTDDILEENLEHTTSLLVDETRDTLDTTSAGKTADGGLRNTLDVVPQDFSVALSSTLPQTFTTFSTSTHISEENNTNLVIKRKLKTVGIGVEMVTVLGLGLEF